MNLARALRVSDAPRLAFVGAGGKTSAMFRLARQMKRKPVLVSTTTHLAIEQLRLADVHVIAGAPQDVRAQPPRAKLGVLVYTGEQVDEERVGGLSPAAMDALGRMAAQLSLPLLVEADGSRRRALKAPAAHEPVIPAFVDQVVNVAGLSVLGKTLDEENVYRSSRFAELGAGELGETITPEMIARVCLHPLGGLKGIPSGARRWALLNQAATDELQSQAAGIAAMLIGAYAGVTIANISHYAAWDNRGDPPEEDVLAVHERVAGVILAAGASQRMGQVKQLLPWRGRPLVEHVARAALSAGLDPLIVVSGSGAEQLGPALAHLPLRLVNNPDWASGQSTSMITGLNNLPEDCAAVVFLQADQPLVSPDLIAALVEAHSRSLSPIVAPLVNGERSSPVLFDRETFDSLAQIRGDVGGRPLFSRYRVEWLEWFDESVRLDVDSDEDYRRLLEAYP